MPLLLSEKDLTELQNLLNDFRHKEACVVTHWLNQKITRQRMEEMEAKAEASKATAEAGPVTTDSAS